jgi:hypothetical protein
MAMTKAMKLSITDFRIGLFVGILSKNEARNSRPRDIRNISIQTVLQKLD